METRQKIILSFFLVIVSMLMFALIGGVAWSKVELPKSVSIGTNPMGSLFQIIGAGLATVTNKHSPMIVKVKPLAGPMAWLPMLRTGEVAFGVQNAADASAAYTGTLYFKEKHPTLRLAQIGFVTIYGPVVRKESGITRIQDLKGKVSAGIYGAHPIVYAFGTAYLANAGLTWSDFSKIIPVATYPDGIKVLVERRVDVGHCGSVGSAVIAEADANVGVRVLPVDPSPDAVRRLKETTPGSHVAQAKSDFPGEVRKGDWFLAANTCLVTDESVSEDVVYEVVKALWSNYKELAPIHPSFKDWTPEVMVGANASIPFHSGAIRFYKEAGAWNKEMETLQKELLSRVK